MVAVVVEHVVLAAGVLLWHLIDDLGQSVVHDGDLTEIYFAVEDVVGPLGFHFEDAWIFGVGRTYTVTIFYIALSKDGYPISTPVWKAPKPIPSRHLLKVRKSYMFRYILNVFMSEFDYYVYQSISIVFWCWHWRGSGLGLGGENKEKYLFL